uniref:Ubiquitin-like protease family profile domain-containing protein n=1 Tax=Lactuca sativa TaxID=4236 RepID=A0A9R1UVQ8_LACSA|nr:hypothetical protein LSAT_V11C800420220 [Lactuca sativa]
MSMPLSIVPFKNEEKGFNRRGDRPRMKSDYLKSPDIIRGEPTDIVFHTLDGFFAQRFQMEMLNLDESKRAPESHLRVYCKTELTLFLPVVRSFHIFLFVINLQHLDFVIIDNSKVDDHIDKMYILDYFKSQNHLKTEMFSHVMPHRLEMPWRTINNHIDCGVFTMRHMETYMGGSMNEFKVGFKNESPAQDDQLAKLRTKYLYKIITREYNVHKDYVLQKVDKFHKIPARQRSKLLSITKEQIHTRLDDFS